jgi:hypothetical protein
MTMLVVSAPFFKWPFCFPYLLIYSGALLAKDA